MKIPTSRKVFLILNGLLLGLLAIISLFPFINLLALSLSSSNAVGMVTVYPIGFTLNAYKFLIQQNAFINAFLMSVKRVVLGTSVSMVLMVLMAYPLTLPKDKFHFKMVYVSICIISMFFSGGLIPMFLLIRTLGIYNSIWALVLPGSVNVWSMILLINFFRKVPEDLTDYAAIEGAGHFRILWSIVLPVSIPVIATVVLLTAIFHWNSWFDGYLYMSSDNYPLQTYIYNILDTLKELQLNPNKTPEQIELMKTLGDTTLRSAQVFIAMIPIMCVYPFAQRYFVKGLLLGSVKE